MIEITVYILGSLSLYTIYSMYNYLKYLKNAKKEINESFGRRRNTKDIKADMKRIASYFKNKKSEYEFFIDDITWNDTNMDEIFLNMNYTQSSAGEEVLYNILRLPIYDNATLKERDNLINFFQNNEKHRVELQYNIAKVGKIGYISVSDYFYNKIEYHSSNLLLYRVLSLIPIASLLLTIISKYGLVLFIASLLFNAYLNNKIKRRSGYDIEAFMYMISLVNCAKKIQKLNIEEIKEKFPRIDENINKVKGIRSKYFNPIAYSTISDAMMMGEYLNMLFLKSVIKFEKIKHIVLDNKEDIKAIYEFIGSIDSYISIASYRESLNYYTKPELTNSSGISDNHLEFIDMYHPFVENPVSNSDSFFNSILITGSNASGKSTFLRTLAVNAVTAQTIYTCFAREYRSSYFNIYTSMALKDDIFSNESYYMVEIRSLKRILDNINDKMPCLCFIDEILRGTNTVERISSSCEVLKYLGSNNCICIAATHDIELTYILENNFKNYHFQEYITESGITFDYKLHPGRTQTRNAIKLLEFMGYDKDIVQRAEERASNFLNTGVWSELENSTCNK